MQYKKYSLNLSKQIPTSKETPLIVKIGAISIELYPGFKVETLREAIAAIRAL